MRVHLKIMSQKWLLLLIIILKYQFIMDKKRHLSSLVEHIKMCLNKATTTLHLYCYNLQVLYI